METRILLVEDDLKAAEFVKEGLQRAGYEVSHAADGLSAYDLASSEGFSLAVVDIMLPKLDGVELIRKLRQDGHTLPILVLSARGTVNDKVEGLSSGADDYLTKPFALAELTARLQALLRRGEGGYESETLQLDDLTVDLSTHKVTRAGKTIELQPKEFKLLVYLLRNANKVVPKSLIMEKVWDFNFDPMSNVVEARMCCLRDKISKGFDNKLIKTIRGVGYMITDE